MSRGRRYTVPKQGDRWPTKVNHLDPDLTGPQAFDHPAVREWWRWLLEDYKPPYSVALVTPCSNVKPYNRSPQSRKIRGLLRRMRLWDSKTERPRGLAWLYFSDLLLLVPYERAGEYPACCYDLPPDLIEKDTRLQERLVQGLAQAIQKLVDRGLSQAVLFLPQRYLTIWRRASVLADRWLLERIAKYSLFGIGELEAVLRSLFNFTPSSDGGVSRLL